jgi:hypothetical protein
MTQLFTMKATNSLSVGLHWRGGIPRHMTGRTLSPATRHISGATIATEKPFSFTHPTLPCVVFSFTAIKADN